MDDADLEQFFTGSWSAVVKRSKASLDTDDRETVETFGSWDNVMSWLSGSAPPSVNLIRPALGHLHVFAEFFQSNLASSLDTSYLWGSLTCLLQ
ncbi:hypothetical protein BJ166DRAFT_211631 [Pestalotiopsis sp. NC0098]|nr:hypothetical protein BJ166DRAFT_211631 [Pestalotiopsis sp. NC0098]